MRLKKVKGESKEINLIFNSLVFIKNYKNSYKINYILIMNYEINLYILII